MKIAFLADEFADKFIGGACFSLQAHIDTCPYPYIKLHTKDLDLKQMPKDHFVIIGNFFNLSPVNMFALMRYYDYVVEECDYKYCRFRSADVHKVATGEDCDCHYSYGKTIAEFLYGAKYLFWKAQAQRDIYYGFFPKLAEVPSKIMGGVYTEHWLEYILQLKNSLIGKQYNKYLVLKTDSWIKGTAKSVAYCKEHNLPYKLVGNIPYEEMLKELATSKGIVYFPNGFDPSCRMITEAVLLGIEVITDQEKVQHLREDYFGNEYALLKFLRSRNQEFWEAINGIHAGLVA